MKEQDFSVFDQNLSFYGDYIESKFDKDKVLIIREMSNDGMKKKILDIGGASGGFFNLLKKNEINHNFTIIDPCENLIKKINNKNIEIIQGSLPFDLPENVQYDVIHLRNVLHHVVDRNIKKTKQALLLSIKNMKKMLKPQGFLIIDEYFYESYFVSSLTRWFIFNLLKWQNYFKIKIPFKEFLVGLLVCFYSRHEIYKNFLLDGFKIKKIKHIDYSDTIKKKILFLKTWGSLLLVVQKNAS